MTRIGLAPEDCHDPDVIWLSARVVALLVLLHKRPRTVGAVAAAFDVTDFSLDDLVADAVLLDLVSIARQGRGPSLDLVQLTTDGIGWLERNGLIVAYRSTERPGSRQDV